jgi:hypothetical protein
MVELYILDDFNNPVFFPEFFWTKLDSISHEFEKVWVMYWVFLGGVGGRSVVIDDL